MLSQPSPVSARIPARICVYTALIGDYEPLNEQAMAAQSSIPFICFTDNPDLRSKSWNIKHVPTVFAMDSARSQRELKLRPHVHLRDYDASLYIDNSVLLVEKPEAVFERYFPQSGICLPEHSYRESALDEFLQVARLGLDDQSRIFEQLNHYTILCPEILRQRPYWGGILLRDHRSEEVRSMSDIWLAHVLRYTRRDQLSANVAFWQSGLTPDVMQIDNFSSWFHSWPHAKGRARLSGTRLSAAAFAPPQARIRQLERELGKKGEELARLKGGRGPMSRLRRLLGRAFGRK